MSLDLCLKELHVVHIKFFHRMQNYTFALVLLRHFPVLQIPPPVFDGSSISTPVNSSHPSSLSCSYIKAERRHLTII